MSILSNHGLANAGEVLTEERKKGPLYKKWTDREERIVEVQGLLGKTVEEIASRLSHEGYSRSSKSIVTLLGKLGLNAKGSVKAVPFASK